MILFAEKWVRKPDSEGKGFLHAWVESGDTEYPILFETRDVSVDAVSFDDEQEWEVVLECADRPKIYSDEASFLESEEQSPMDMESAIPIGLLLLNGKVGNEPFPGIVLSGIVERIYDDPSQYGFADGDLLYSVSCMEHEYLAVLKAEHTSDVVISEGDIVSGAYLVQGRLKS